MKRDLINWLFDNLEFFQSFESIRIYYDKGQKEITSLLHGAVEYALSKEALTFRNASPVAYRLAQVADFICGIELAALRYQAKQQTATDGIFFGGSSAFKKNWLKKVRGKTLGKA